MATRGFEHVTIAEAQKMGRGSKTVQPKRAKYRNVRVTLGHEKFDSKREAECWLQLKARESAGDIRNLRRQQSFPLLAPCSDGSHIQVSEYIADFTFEERVPHVVPETWQRVVADAKGGKATQTALFKHKAKHLNLQDGITIRIL